MSLNDDLVAMQQAVDDFGVAYKAKLAAKAQEAETADTALKLDNKTNAEFADALDAPLTTHIADTHAHALSAAQVGTYTQDQINTMVAQRVAVASLDVSRVGDTSYLAIGIESKFEGATTNFESRAYHPLIEDDGTMVYLRNGTTGSVQGVFYAYVPNALMNAQAGQAMQAPVRTNRRYQPSYFPANTTARYIVKSDENLVAGRLQSNTGALGDYFISYANGTLNDSAHTGFFIAASYFPNGQTSWSKFEFVMAPDGTVYILIATPINAGTDPVELQLWRVPAGTANGAYATPVQLTGWASSGFGGVSLGTTTNLRMANKLYSTASADNPFWLFNTYAGNFGAALLNPDSGGIATVTGINAAGTQMRIRLSCDNYVVDSNNGNNVRPWVGISYLVDLSNKTFALESPASLSQPTINMTPTSLTFSGGAVANNHFNFNASTVGNSFDNMAFHPLGYWFNVYDQNLPDSTCFVSWGKIATTPNNRFDATRYDRVIATVNDFKQSSYSPEYGSAIGGSITGNAIAGSYGLICAIGRTASGDTQRGLVHFQYGAETATYGSLQNGNMSGYQPAPYRKFVSDMGIDPVSVANLVYETTAAGVTTVSGGFFMENINTSGPLSVDMTTLAKTGTVSIAAGVFDTLRSAGFSAAGINPANVKQSRVTLVVPQNTNVAPWMTIVWISTANTEYISMFSLNLTGGSRTGQMTAFSIQSFVGTGTLANNVSEIQDHTNYAQFGGGIAILEVSDAWLIGGVTKHMTARSGTSGGCTYRIAVTKAAPPYLDSSSLSWAAVPLAYDTQFYGQVPGKGFGVFYCANQGADYMTKLVFWPIATTLAQFRSWTQPALAAWRVIQSQDVAQGWTVYFTKKTPVVIAGKYIVLAPGQMDLTTIQANPANSQFYVYVEYDPASSTAKYAIYATPQPETRTRVYVANIITGANSITTITTEKPTRIGMSRVSTSPRGSAIAVTAGLPSDTTQQLAPGWFRALRVGSYGYSAPNKNWVGINNPDGSVIATPNNNGRGFTVWGPDRLGNTVYNETFDVSASSAECTRMAQYLNALPANQLVVIYANDNTWSDPPLWQQSDLFAAISALGATAAVYNNIAYRSAYILIGSRNKPRQLEVRKGTGTTTVDDPTAYLGYQFNLRPDGQAVGITQFL